MPRRAGWGAAEQARVGKQDRIRELGGRAAPELAVDEVGDASEEKADGGDGGGEVQHRQDVETPRAGEGDDREGGAHEPAVERHASRHTARISAGFAR